MKSKRRMLAVIVAVPALALAGFAIAGGLLDQAKSATAPFHNTDVARHAGYTNTVADTTGNVCIAEPGVGGMGVHLLNPNLLDTTIDPKHPEALVYRPKANGALKLAALEYIVFKQAWQDAKGANAPAPSLFGQALPPEPRAEPVRHPGVLRFARLGLEGQSDRDVPAVEPEDQVPV